VTVVLMMKLSELGMFNIDDKVETYFPEVKQLIGYANYSPLTFRQLAGHTSGLDKEPALPNAAAGPIAEWEDKILASIPTTSLVYPPGERFSYSNIGIGMLGLALSRIAQKPYMSLVQEFIFDPLNMTGSCFIITPEWQPHLTVGYENSEDGTVDRELPCLEHKGRGYKVPNGGMYTTIGNLARFATLHLGTAPVQVLSAASRAEMQTVHGMETKICGYGLGLRVDILEDGHHVFRHGGSVAGYSAGMAFDPESQLGVAVLRNYKYGEKELNEYVTELLCEVMSVKT
jgi:CubicO group peptidase (beta-lactamase class C family)